jgi:hypothetical protein
MGDDSIEFAGNPQKRHVFIQVSLLPKNQASFAMKEIGRAIGNDNPYDLFFVQEADICRHNPDLHRDTGSPRRSQFVLSRRLPIIA